MITQLILDFLHALAVELSDFIRNAVPTAPQWLASMTAGLTTAFNMIPSAVRYFVPIQPVATAGVAFVGLVASLGLIRFVRRVLSLFTGGGGQA